MPEAKPVNFVFLILFHHVSFFVNSFSTISELSHYQNIISTVVNNIDTIVPMVNDPEDFNFQLYSI